MNNNYNFIEEGIKAFQEENFEEVIKIFSNIDINALVDDETKNQICMCMGESHERLSDYLVALEWYRKASDTGKILKNNTMVFNALYRIISVYCIIKDYESAESFNRKALDIAHREKDPILIAKAYNALGILCNDYTDKTLTIQKIGLRAFKRAMNAIEGIDIPELKAIIHINLGCTYTDFKECETALEHLFIAHDLIKDSNHAFLLSTIDFNLAEAFFEKKDYDNTLLYLNKAMEVFKEKNYRINLAEAYGLYSKLYEKQEIYKEALEYSRLYIELMLDIKNTDYIRTVSSFQMQYEVLKLEKDKEIYRIKNEELKQLNYELKAAYEIVNTLSETDFLTSFYNRRGLEYSLEALDEENEHGVLLLDIDYFKSINDNFGHHVGDEVLRSVADRIRRNVNEEECVLVRFGGEEFIIILKNSSKEETFDFGKSILDLIKREEFIVEQSRIKVTATAGVDSFRGRKKDFNESVRRADIKLYQGKMNGRDTIII